MPSCNDEAHVWDVGPIFARLEVIGLEVEQGVL